MKKVILLMFAAAALPLVLHAETWKNAALLDSMCASKDAIKADPDSHTTKCAISCQKGGYGILAADGGFLKFDAAGNEKVAVALKATKKTDHLRATVEGEKKGSEIQVKSISLD